MSSQQILLKGYGAKVPWQGNRGIYLPLYDGSFTDQITYITIDSTGNASDFGDSTFAGSSRAGFSGDGRAISGGGGGSSNQDVIEYFAISSTGNASDFGDLTHGDRANLSGCSDGERGVFGGGAPTSRDEIIDYITIATTGNTSDFGDLVEPGFNTGTVNNDTRGVWGGGNTTYGFPGTKNVLQYITIKSTGNATDFGDLNKHRQYTAGCSSKAGRGVFGFGGYLPGVGGGMDRDNSMEYITIATTGNGTDFGDMISSPTQYKRIQSGAACANETRGVFSGGEIYGNSYYDVIQYITIASTGNCTDFGDLIDGGYGGTGLSGD